MQISVKQISAIYIKRRHIYHVEQHRNTTTFSNSRPFKFQKVATQSQNTLRQ